MEKAPRVFIEEKKSRFSTPNPAKKQKGFLFFSYS